MKKGFFCITREVFIVEENQVEFQIGNLKRKSIDNSDISRDSSEQLAVKKFISHYAPYFLHLSGLGEGYIGLEISSILDQKISRKPGDIDLAFVNVDKTDLHCFEVKRIKIGDKLNKTSKLKSAKSQLKGYLKYHFSSVSLIIINEIKQPVQNIGVMQKNIISSIDDWVGIEFFKKNGIGLIFIDHVQDEYLSMNTIEHTRLTFSILPQIKSVNKDLVIEILKDKAMFKQDIDDNAKKTRLHI